MRLIHPKATNNNCFFKCIQPYIPELNERIIRSECNRIRKQFDIKPDDKVDVKSALRIFEKHNSNGKYGIEIWSKDIPVGEVLGTDSTLTLSLEDDHYSIMEIKKYQRCEECGRKFINKHTCNTNMIVYKKIAEGRNRYVVNGFKQDKFNFDKPNEDIVVVHYDIETHTRSGPDNMRVHIPYIIGFVDNISNSFQHFTGSDCMEKFIVHLFGYRKECNIYINAYNGSKFKHYEFVKKLNKMYSDHDDGLFKLD